MTLDIFFPNEVLPAPDRTINTTTINRKKTTEASPKQSQSSRLFYWKQICTQAQMPQNAETDQNLHCLH